MILFSYCIAIVAVGLGTVVWAAYLHFNKGYRPRRFMFSELMDLIPFCLFVVGYVAVLLLAMPLVLVGLTALPKALLAASPLLLPLGIVVWEHTLQRRYNRFMQQQRLQPSLL